ncbi:MAG: response regulator, partial [Acidobacteriota bacterium]
VFDGELKPGRYLKLTVSDTGFGMRPSTIERIFDPYFTTKEMGKGSGLGLAVVRGIVRRHQGGINVRSRAGVGSAFEIYIPAVAFTPPTQMTSAEAPSGGREHILFVDDEDMAVDFTKKVLESLGYRVTALASSRKALDIFRANPEAFDLLFTDYTMPGLTGAELARRCMEIRPELPCVLCTGYSERITEEIAREIGFSAYAMKPLSLREMAAVIRKALDRRTDLRYGAEGKEAAPPAS